MAIALWLAMVFLYFGVNFRLRDLSRRITVVIIFYRTRNRAGIFRQCRVLSINININEMRV